MSDNTRIRILLPSDAPVYKALKLVFRELAPQMTVEYSTTGKPSGSKEPAVGLVVALTKDDVFTELGRLEDSAVQKTIVVRPWHHITPAWATLLPEDKSAFEDFCIPATPDVQSSLNAITSTVHGDEGALNRESRRQVFAAKTFFNGAIRDLSHGSSHDVVNCIYAPARMLCLFHNSQPDEDISLAWQEWWNAKTTQAAFKMLQEKDIAASITDALATAFMDAWNRAKAWLISQNPPPVGDAPVTQIERLMSLLTTIRQRAGISVHPQGGWPSAPPDELTVTSACGDPDLEPYRLLVVDDHAASWKPVLELVAKRLATDLDLGKRPVRVKFATSVTENVRRGISEYDLVLLDIYLPGQKDAAGVDLLKQVRRMVGGMPIVLWTSSLDRDLPAEASLASGFLFKKTATVDTIYSLVKDWLSAGRSQRLWSLPNPFFDNAIRDLSLRQVALDFTKWTLRYMDCFHAIDDFHFRYFNDHGGRHIIGILSVMEKLLRPFLLADGSRVLSVDSRGRTRDLFCLYVAVLCHEFGMFPIMDTDLEAEMKDASTQAESRAIKRPVLEGMRQIHALRGMMLLVSRYEHNAVPRLERYARRVAGIERRLCQLHATHDSSDWLVIALLIGYHQRLLPLSKDSDGLDRFLHLGDSGDEWSKVRAKLDAANRSLKGSGVSVAAIKAVFAHARERLSELQRETLRRQCAILRFADALDVDQTRAPADFLLEERDSRRPMQDVEDCKRLALAECRIDHGVITVKFLGDEPGPGLGAKLLPLVRASVDYHVTNGENDKVKEEAMAVRMWLERRADSKAFMPGSSCDKSLLKLRQAWAAPSPRNYLEQEWVCDISRYISHAVSGYFVLCRFQEEDGCEIAGSRIEFLTNSQRYVATAAAVLVLLEVLDEYQAIHDAELSDAIRLDPTPLWRAQGDELPSILHTALMFLQRKAGTP